MNSRNLILIGAVLSLALASGCATVSQPAKAGRLPIPVADFEPGTGLAGWTADPNWRVDDNSAGGWYQGWQGQGFAWSGVGGEPALGKLRSTQFKLQRHGVEVVIAGWSDIRGVTANRWNYVTLNLADGAELDRAYSPNATAFMAVFLNGRGNEGEEVYVEAVDDAAEPSFSMLCLDTVTQKDMPPTAAPPVFPTKNIAVLENDFYRVEAEKVNGRITRILDKKGDTEILREPRLAGNFKFTLPIPGEAAWQATEANYILGDAQPLTRAELADGALKLYWDGPFTSVTGMTCDAAVVMTIAFEGERIVFNMHVDNRTPYEIGELYYPILGGMRGLAPSTPGLWADLKATELQMPNGAGADAARVFHTFANQSWLGILGPEQHYSYPGQLVMPWMDLYQKATDRGVWFAALDPVARYKVLHLDMQPGIAGARSEGNWPRPDELNGMAAGVRAAWVHMPYHPAGQPFDASPVVLQAHAGDWKQAAALYGEWGQTAFPAAQPGPDRVYFRCEARPLTALREAAVKAKAEGANTLLVTNWKPAKDGMGEPWFALPDEAVAAMRETIAACHAEGVRVEFVMDIEPAMQRGPLFENTLKPFVCTDRWETPDTMMVGGNTFSHSENIATQDRRAILNPASPAYAAALAGQTAKLAALGVDGIHVTRFFGRVLDFTPAVGLAPDQASWAGGLRALDGMLTAARGVNPAFTLSVDFLWDRLLPYTVDCGPVKPEASPLATAFPAWRGGVPPAKR